jgi:hypothetical protein
VHLLRELEKGDAHYTPTEPRAFARALRRLFRDGIRLRMRPDFTPERYRSLRLRRDDPLQTISDTMRTCLQTAQLPESPPAAAADG